VTAVPVNKGAILSMHELAFKKPGDGISAARYREVVGRKTVRDLPAEHLLTWEDLQ